MTLKETKEGYMRVFVTEKSKGKHSVIILYSQKVKKTLK